MPAKSRIQKEKRIGKGTKNVKRAKRRSQVSHKRCWLRSEMWTQWVRGCKLPLLFISYEGAVPGAWDVSSAVRQKCSPGSESRKGRLWEGGHVFSCITHPGFWLKKR